MNRSDRQALRRRLMAAMQAVIAAWKTMPLRQAMEAVYGDGWTEARFIVTTPKGKDVHVWTRLPQEQAAG